MGGGNSTMASNITNIVAEATVKLVNEVTQNNVTVVTNVNSIKFDGCTIDNLQIFQEGAVNVDIQGVQASVSTLSTKQNIDAVAKQLASAIGQNVNIGVGDSVKSKNVANLTAKAYSEIVNKITQSCFTSATMANEVICHDSTLKNSLISQKTWGNFVTNCVQNAAVDAKSYQALKAAVEQTAKAKTANAIWSLALALIALVIILVGTGGVVVKDLTNWKFVLAATPLALIAIYLIVADRVGMWPFKAKQADLSKIMILLPPPKK